MDSFFNELSCYPLCSEDCDINQRLLDFALVLDKVKEDGFNVVRCSKDNGISDILLMQDYSIADYCNSNPRGVLQILFMSMLKPPFFKEGSTQAETFNKGIYTLENYTEEECYGLSAAYINGSYAVGFSSCDLWKNSCLFNIKYTTDKRQEKYVVFCFSHVLHFSGEEHWDWLIRNRKFNFEPSEIAEVNKICNLSSDHHGNNELRDFARKSLFPLPYIDSVVTSLAFQPYCKSFVSGLQIDSCRIEVVMHWTEDGYGMVIQTTARNELELRQMAKDLEGRFGKKSR